MVRVFITDDHEIYLEGLSLLLGKQDGIEVIGTAASGRQLMGEIQGLQADILLLDVYLPDMGEEDLLQQIRALRPDLKIIYLTLLRGTRYIHKLTKHMMQRSALKKARQGDLL